MSSGVLSGAVEKSDSPWRTAQHKRGGMSGTLTDSVGVKIDSFDIYSQTKRPF